MTDLISTLADQIIALINSKPSSPSKEEVEALLRDTIDPQLDAIYDNIIMTSEENRCPYYGATHEFTLWGKDKNGILCMPNGQWDVTGGSVLRCLCGAEPPGANKP